MMGDEIKSSPMVSLVVRLSAPGLSYCNSGPVGNNRRVSATRQPEVVDFFGNYSHGEERSSPACLVPLRPEGGVCICMACLESQAEARAGASLIRMRMHLAMRDGWPWRCYGGLYGL
jgi:hypothetical protein